MACAPLLEEMLRCSLRGSFNSPKLDARRGWKTGEDAKDDDDAANDSFWFARGLLCCRVAQYADAGISLVRAAKQLPHSVHIISAQIWLWTYGDADTLRMLHATFCIFLLDAMDDAVQEERIQECILFHIAKFGMEAFQVAYMETASELPESSGRRSWSAWIEKACIKYAVQHKKQPERLRVHSLVSKS